MSHYISEVVKKISKNGETVVLMLDQSQIHEDRQCLMISLRLGDRAIPVLWGVEDTKGNIGFDKQEELLNKVKKMMPPGVDAYLPPSQYSSENFDN
jgi:hypothetical protein